MSDELKINTYIRQKDGGWQYIIRYKDSNGVWVPKSKQGFKSENEARIAMMQRYPEVEKMARQGIIDEHTTLEDFYKTYIEHEKLYKEYNTLKKHRTAFSNFGKMKTKELGKITNRDIQNMVDSLIIKGCANGTIETYVASLKVMLRSAKEEYKLLVELPSFKYKIKDNKVSKIKKALTIDEVEKMLSDLKDSRYYLIFLIAAKTGMRLGEILGLCWEDIDFDNNEINVNKQLKRIGDTKHELGSLKTENSNRIIPLPNSLKTVLEPLKGKDRVFAFRSTVNVGKYVNIQLKPYGITIHELRHTYATTLIANGLDFKTVAYLMGHTVEMTMRIYTHVTVDMKNNAFNKINNIL